MIMLLIQLVIIDIATVANATGAAEIANAK